MKNFNVKEARSLIITNLVLSGIILVVIHLIKNNYYGVLS